MQEEEQATPGLKSVTEETSYEEFIATATLSQKDFAAERLNSKFVVLSAGGGNVEDVMTAADKKLVVVPRRPKWTKDMTAEELDELEREAFLQWRRSMAHLQNKEGITPFERNLEVWRQLWRVIERSDIIVQIVDARHPLLYRCKNALFTLNNILLCPRRPKLTKYAIIYNFAVFAQIGRLGKLCEGYGEAERTFN